MSKSSLSVKEGTVKDSYDISFLLLGKERRFGVPTTDVTVYLNVSSGGAADILITPAVLTFTPSNWETPQTVTVSAIDDFKEEDDAEGHVITHTVECMDPILGAVGVRNVYVTVWDKKPPPPMEAPVLIRATGGLLKIGWELHPIK